MRLALPPSGLPLNQKFTIVMPQLHKGKDLFEARRNMDRHEWIVRMLDEMSEYAKLNALSEVEDVLTKARAATYKELSEKKGEISNVLQFPLRVLFG